MSDEKQKIRDLLAAIEDYRDFLEWLFDEEVDYMTQREAWEKFEKWQESQNDKTKSHV